MSSVLLTEQMLQGEVAFALGVPVTSLNIDWAWLPLPDNWQIMAMHEARTAFLNAIIAEMREKLTSHNE